MIDFIPLQYYTWIYYWLMTCLCLICGMSYASSENCNKLLHQNSSIGAFLFTVIITLYVGLRPISGRYFADMGMYAHGYNMCNVNSFSGFFDFKSEWFFEFIMKFCKTNIGDVNIWFLIIDIFYFGCHYWACKRLLHENVWMAMMFVCFSYQFFTFGTNGLRNGMGCALMMLAISFFAKRNWVGFSIGFFIFLLAMGSHRSTMIPMAAVLASLFVVKKIKHAIYTWFLCILLSLVAGGAFQSFFISLGVDDRMSAYSSYGDKSFSHSGFRWDFLLYSAMPILLAWYVDKRGVKDKTFTLLANTYIIANSFWVLVCRVAFSNRFAYLSWFLYALVIAYAVIRVPIWKDQDKKAGQILLAHTFFTMFMYLIGK